MFLNSIHTFTVIQTTLDYSKDLTDHITRDKKWLLSAFIFGQPIDMPSNNPHSELIRDVSLSTINFNIQETKYKSLVL